MHKSVEQSTEHRNRPTQISPIDFLTKLQKQFDGGMITFSTNGAGELAHPLEKKKLHPASHLIQKLTQNGSWT